MFSVTPANSKNGLLFAAWNQDQGCFACGMDNGFRIYNSDPLKERQRKDFIDGGIGFVEMLFRCNYLALVGGGNIPKYSPSKVMIWDDLKERLVFELDFTPHRVRGVRLRRDRVVVILDTMIKVYTMMSTPTEVGVFETAQNPKGLCVLCPDSNNGTVCFPAPFRVGHVEIHDLIHPNKSFQTIAAHNSHIAQMALNIQGTTLATCSEKGTLIRVFNVDTCDHIFEFRRGSNSAIIYSLAFNQEANKILCSSDHGTVHIFQLDPSISMNPASANASLNISDKSTSSSGPLNNATSASATLSASSKKSNPTTGSSFLPKIFQSHYSFCKFQIPGNSHSICAFGAEPNSVLVVCSDGSYYRFVFTPKGDVTRDVYAQFLEMTDDE